MKINLMVVISLVVAMSAAMVAPVGAAPTGTSVITGNPGYIIDIVVTGDITGWALVAGTTNTNSTGVDLVVSSNEIGWTVAVRDALDGSKDAATAGKMTNYTGSSYASGSLAANLTVAGESVSGKSTGAGVTLSGIPQTIETGLDVVTSDSMHITIGQAVAYTDPRLPNPNVYRIIVTFTGTTP
jgi:hypothetical protein